jgi:hypothetical protein
VRALLLEIREWFWKGCKPNSVCASRRRESFVWAADTRNPSAFAELERAAPGFPIWPCTRWGFPCRVACASRGGLLHHLFTLAASNGLRRFDFLWHCPSESLSTSRPRVSQSNGLGLRGIAPCGVRTFLFRLAPKAILRPSKTNVKLPEIKNYSSRESSSAGVKQPNGKADLLVKPNIRVAQQHRPTTIQRAFGG